MGLPMQFVLVVLGAPGGGGASASALRFARAALAAGHALRQVFFHGEGARAAAAVDAAGAPAECAGWRELAARGVPLLACQTALSRRGLVADPGAPVRPGSLGQLLAALPQDGRVITFAD